MEQICEKKKPFLQQFTEIHRWLLEMTDPENEKGKHVQGQ